MENRRYHANGYLGYRYTKGVLQNIGSKSVIKIPVRAYSQFSREGSHKLKKGSLKKSGKSNVEKCALCLHKNHAESNNIFEIR